MAVEVGITELPVAELDPTEEVLLMLEEQVAVDELLSDEIQAEQAQNKDVQGLEMLNALDELLVKSNSDPAVIAFIGSDANFVELFGDDATLWHDRIQQFVENKRLQVSQESLLGLIVFGSIIWGLAEMYLKSMGRIQKVLNQAKTRLTAERMENSHMFGKARTVYLDNKIDFDTRIHALIGISNKLSAAKSSVLRFSPGSLKSDLAVAGFKLNATIKDDIEKADIKGGAGGIIGMITGAVLGYVVYSSLFAGGAAAGASVGGLVAGVPGAIVGGVIGTTASFLGIPFMALAMIRGTQLGRQLLSEYGAPISERGWTRADMIPAINKVNELVTQTAHIKETLRAIEATASREISAAKSERDKLQIRENIAFIKACIKIFTKQSMMVGRGVAEAVRQM